MISSDEMPKNSNSVLKSVESGSFVGAVECERDWDPVEDRAGGWGFIELVLVEYGLCQV